MIVRSRYGATDNIRTPISMFGENLVTTAYLEGGITAALYLCLTYEDLF